MIAAIRATDAGPHQVIDIMGTDPSLDDPIYQAAGYRCGEVEILMDRPITMADAARPDDPRVIHKLTQTQMGQLADVWNKGRTANGYQPILPAHKAAPELAHGFIEIDFEPAA